MDNSTTKQFQPKKKSPLKPILVSLASLVVVVGIGVATAMLLKQNLVKESTGEQQQVWLVVLFGVKEVVANIILRL